MTRWTIFACLISLASVGSATDAPWTKWQDLRRLALLEQTDRVLLRSSYCPSGCRYDRTSDGDPRFLRIEGDEAVIFESLSAGAIVRVWMTMGAGVSEPLDETITIRVYLDDYAAPFIDVPLPTFFDGADARWPAPLAGNREISSGGNFNIAVFPYLEKAKIVLLNALDKRIWFQINHHQRPVGIAGFDQQAWRDFLINSAPVPSPDISGTTAIATGATHTINLNQAGWIIQTRLRSDAKLADLLISWSFDGKTTVEEIPAHLYFALGDDAAINESRMIGRDAEGFLYDRFPKPYQNQATLTIKNSGTVEASVEYEIGIDPSAPPVLAAYFGAQFQSQCPSIPGTDITLASLTGAGRWVGVFQLIHSVGGHSRSYLEGDERAYVDGMIDPLWYGTGVEDFYSGGFYFDQGVFSLPLHGSTYHDQQAGIVDTTGMYRWMINDYLPFKNGLQVHQETGPWGLLELCNQSVVYFYQRPAPMAQLQDQLTMSLESRSNHQYQADGTEFCTTIDSQYLDNPPTQGSQLSCQTETGQTWQFVIPDPSKALTITRTVNAENGQSGAELYIDGVLSGRFSPIPANATHRFAEQVLDLEARSASTIPATRYEFQLLSSATDVIGYELLAPLSEILFLDGYETKDP